MRDMMTDLLQDRLETAVEEILELKRAEAELKRKLADTEIEVKFWRVACEQALKKWDEAEDALEAARAEVAARLSGEKP